MIIKTATVFALIVIVLDTSLCIEKVNEVDLRSSSAPNDAITLGFVFDVTGSMWDDLQQVISGAEKILDTILRKKEEKWLFNYILVPFHDPEIGPVTVTSDPDYFLGQLRLLNVHGGGDCPEMSVGAIKLALDHSMQNSFLYVFTDARAKDYYLLEEVLRLVQAKETQVVFVMTGDCGNQTHPGFKAYEKIASTSSGQVFHLKKSDVNEVLEFVRASLQSRKVNLLAVDRARGPGPDIIFNVDSGLKEFTVSSAGDRPEIVLINPKGNVATSRDGLSTLLSLSNVQIVQLVEPSPGPWTLRTGSLGPHTLRSKGLSRLDFVHGFSSIPVETMGQTKPHPIKGDKTYVLVTAVNATSRAHFDKVEFLDMSGNQISQSPLENLSRNPGTYRSRLSHTPNEYFYLKVSGIDDQGHPFQRITPTAIGSKLPDIPDVSTPSLVTAYSDKLVNLNCTVQSVVPFSVQWFRNDQSVSPLQRFQSYREVVTLNFPNVNPRLKGMYTCKASNVGGSSVSTVYMDIKDEPSQPPIIYQSNNVTVVSGHDATLSCLTRPSRTPLTYHWSRPIQYQSTQDQAAEPLDPSKFTQYPNGEFFIREATKAEEGWYTCSVQSNGGRTDSRLYLSVTSSSRLEISPRSVTYVYSDRVTLKCVASGHPPLTVQWVYHERFQKALHEGRIRINSEEFLIENALPEDQGEYVCEGLGPGVALTASAQLKYSEIPEIVVPKRNIKVNQGQSAVLHCVGEGIPDPRLRWFKGDQELEGATDRYQVLNNGFLRIMDTIEDDTGSYRCVATNVAGTAEETIFLQVGEPSSPPAIDQADTVETVKATQGGRVTLRCQVTGNPTPEVTWSINGRVLLGKIGPKLELDSVMVNQGGRYACHAKNKAGAREKDFHLTVLVAPKFTDEQEGLVPYISKSISAGGPLELQCNVKGVPTPDITWLRNDHVIIENEDSNLSMSKDKKTLIIQSVTEKDAGNYTCIAENEAGKIKKTSNIEVLVPPSVERKGPKKVVVKELDDLVLQCRVKGHPSPDIHWLRNGQFLPKAVHGDQPVKLLLTNIKAHQKGTYSCMATNPAGRDQRDFSVEVQVPPKRKDSSSPSTNEVRVLLNEPLLLNCDVEGHPPPVILWFKDDLLMQFYPQTDFRLSDDGRHVSVPSSNRQIEGNYSCFAQNNAGDDRIIFNVQVIVPPYIDATLVKKVLTQARGKDVELECPILARPFPGVTWLKNGHLFRDTTLGRKLKLTGVELDSAGMYICIVGNEGGNMEHQIELQIAVPPKFKEDDSTSDRITSILHRPVTLTCHVVAHPPPIVQWFKDGLLLDRSLDPNLSFSADGRQLKLKHTRLMDDGAYTCTATNDVGTTSKDILLEVNVPPSIGESETEIFSSINDTSQLHCPTSGHPNPAIVWLKNGHLIKDDVESTIGYHFAQNRQVLLVVVINKDHAGKYSCIVSNVAGKAEKHFTLEVLVAPSVLGLKNENITVQVGHPLALKCDSTGHPAPTVTWYKDGSLVGDDEEYGVFFSEDRGKQLQILNTENQDGGEYLCEVENAAGSDSKTFLVHITIPPLILKNSTTESLVTVNSRVLLECISQGEPQPNLTWMKDGEVLDEENLGDQAIDLLRRKQVLEIKRAFVNHNGVYTCLAENDAGIDKQDFLLKVFGQPKFTNKSPSNMTIAVGERATLNCFVDAEPIASVFWTKDAKPLDPDSDPLLYLSHGAQTLDILHARIEDSAFYECLAINSVGVAKWNITLQVQSPPALEGLTISNGVEVRYAIAGSTVELECFFVGNPWPNIKWWKNGNNVTRKAGLEILADEQVLKINGVELEDAGNYTCAAFSSAGSANKTINLVIQVPPTILASVPDPSVVLGDSTQLECDLSESSRVTKVTRIWSKNGQPLTSFDDPNISFNPENGRLRILKARLRDSGIYTCLAINEAGSDRVNRNLRVVVPATIERANYDPNPTAVYNQPLTLSCKVEGSLPINIKWYKDGVPLDEHQYTIYHGGQKLDLYLTDDTERGNYSCLVENEAGQDTLEFNVNLLDRPQMEAVSRERLFETQIPEGQSLTLNCPLKDDSPVATITWYKDSLLLTQDRLPPNIIISSDGLSLIIVRAQSSDAGYYRCVASNLAGEASDDIFLDVLVVPWFSETEAYMLVPLNQTAFIECQANGNPEPSLEWLRNDLHLTGSDNVEIDRTVLRIRNIGVEDEGIYSCLATNLAGISVKKINLTVLVAPSLTGPAANISVPRGSNAVFDCPVQGQPSPKVLWYKGSRYIGVSDNGQSMVLTNVTSPNSGTYSCTGVNEAGEITSKTYLTVLVPATVHEVRVDGDSTLVVGSSVQLFCNASGVNSPDYWWTKDGDDLSENATFSITAEGVYLRLNNLEEYHQGLYRCTATNELGQDYKDIFLNVLTAPTVDTANVRIEILEGQSLELECPATGDPKPIVTWARDSQLLTEVNNGILFINSTVPEDQGIYTCKAQNEAGQVLKNISLIILVPPRLAEGSSPENVTALEGQPLTLKCIVEGTPNPNIIWLKDDVIINIGESLVLKDVGPTDEGMFICHANSVVGNYTHEISVSVRSPPKILGQDLVRIKAIENDTVTLICDVSGQPSPDVKWLRNGKPFVPSEISEVISNGVLSVSIVFENLRAGQAGNYTCLAENPAGLDNSTILLNVLVPPVIQTTTSVVKGVSGQEVSLTCQAKGQPSPSIEWARIVGTEMVKISMLESTFRLKSVSTTDEGFYACLARNEAGSAIHEFHLIVEVPPSIQNEEARYTVLAGQSIQLPCQVDGKPIPTIRWKMDNNGVLGDTGHVIDVNGSLLIDQAVPDDSATYVCVAINDIGSFKARRHLQVQAPAKITYISDSLTYGNKGDDLSLTCKATGTPVPSISWQRTDGRSLSSQLDGRIRTRKSGQLEIILLEPEDMATYQCTAQNEVGVDVGFVQLVVHSPPAIEPDNAKEKVILRGGQVALPCRARGFPTPLISWTRNGIPLEFPQHDIRLEPSGDLLILNAELIHNGTYVCSAANPAGKRYQVVTLKVHVPPTITTLPRDLNVSMGNEFSLNCEATGVPTPKLSWLRNDVKLVVGSFTDKESKSQLLVEKASKEDEGVYSCIASNEAGEKKATATLLVKSPPIMTPGLGIIKTKESESVVLDCPVMADPPPAIVWKKGGQVVQDDSRITLLSDGSLEIHDVKVEDSGQYTCVAVNGYGRAQRLTNLAVSSKPRFVIEPNDLSVDEGSTASLECVAIGSPQPIISWLKNGLAYQPGVNGVILVNSTLQVFVVSTKDSGVYECVATNEFGSATKKAYLSVIINGGWSGWSYWSTCTVSCGGGLSQRFRQCDSPYPSPGGRACHGGALESQTCNVDPCPVHGSWSSWGSWSACSVTCNNGVKRRTRLCNNPPPKNGGRRCLGISQQSLTCFNSRCDDTPKLAKGHLVGEINGEDIGLVVLKSNVTQQGDKRYVSAILDNVSPTVGQSLETLLPLLSPIYWASAAEENDAKNGYKLTRGKFQRESDVTFATGENLKVTYVGRGLDAENHLLVDVVITGRTPLMPSPGKGTTLLPYKETYVQTGPDTLHVESTRFHSIHGYNFPEAWKHTVHYDGALGTMKNLVEELKVGDVDSRYDENSQTLSYSLSASISKGNPDCPEGFKLGDGHCKDVNECEDEPSLCSHGCENIVGSYYCLCNTGFTLGPSGHTCQDIDECLRYPCNRNQVCENTIGSFHCLIHCPVGYQRTDDAVNCIDVDECSNIQSCSHLCENTPGSFICSCRTGYHLVGKSNCLDIDECRSRIAPCEQTCTNLPGGYQCGCGPGFTLRANSKCDDIDECSLDNTLCPPGQLCLNKRGGYLCSCREGYAKDFNRTCLDVDECLIGSNKCHHSQICENRPGGYTCSCPTGFESFALGKPCLDVDECVQNPPPCNYRCNNLVGDYECICPPDQKRLANRKACIGIDQSERRPETLMAPRGICPSGMRPTSAKGDCQDIDECQDDWLCQHQCVNTFGSYQCYCPPGYRLAGDGSSCEDINECLELGVKCNEDQTCFNTKGGYKCVETPCPPSYQRDPLTNFCRLECERAPIACPPNRKYADTLAYKMVALSSGIEAYVDLVRLLVFDHDGSHITNAVFDIVENQSNVPFEIRQEPGVGVLYSKEALDNNREYKMKIRAVSYDPLTRSTQYSSQFIVFLSVSNFPY